MGAPPTCGPHCPIITPAPHHSSAASELSRFFSAVVLLASCAAAASADSASSRMAAQAARAVATASAAAPPAPGRFARSSASASPTCARARAGAAVSGGRGKGARSGGGGMCGWAGGSVRCCRGARAFARAALHAARPALNASRWARRLSRAASASTCDKGKGGRERGGAGATKDERHRKRGRLQPASRQPLRPAATLRPRAERGLRATHRSRRQPTAAADLETLQHAPAGGVALRRRLRRSRLCAVGGRGVRTWPPFASTSPSRALPAFSALSTADRAAASVFAAFALALARFSAVS